MDDRPAGTGAFPVTDPTLRRALGTPVGRRWFLGVAGASALAAALAGLPRLPTDSPGPAALRVREDDATPTGRTLHLAVGLPEDQHDGLYLDVSGTRVPLVRHTDDSRNALGAAGSPYARFDLSRLTHVAEGVVLPADRPLRVAVGSDAVPGAALGLLVLGPAATAAQLRELAASVAGDGRPAQAVHRQGAFGVAAGADPLTDDEAAALDSMLDVPYETARTLVYQHPQLVNLDAATHRMTYDVMDDVAEVGALAQAIQDTLDESGTYASTEPLVVGGEPVTLPPEIAPAGGAALSVQQLDPSVDEPLGAAVNAVLARVRDTAALAGKSWVEVVEPAPTSTAVPAAALVAAQDVASLAAPTATLTPVLSRTDTQSGLRAEVVNTSQLTRTVTVKLHNVFIRDLSIFVRFYDADDRPLPKTASPTNEHYAWDTVATFLGGLAEVPNFLGIPILALGSQTYDIVFPPTAVRAAILACGLSAHIGSMDWHAHFLAADGSDVYAEQVKPNECQRSIIMTSIFDLAVPTLLLGIGAGLTAADASVLSEVRSSVDLEAVRAWFAGGQLADVGSAAMLLSSESQNWTREFSDPKSASVWGLLIDHVKVFIALLMRIGAFWQFVAEKTVEAVAESSIPIIGLAWRAANAAGNALALSQTALEMGVSPWVIPNDLAVTYDASVRVAHDPRDGTLPAKATSMTLVPQLSARRSLPAVTVDLGHLADPSAPVVAPVAGIPIGGQVRHTVTLHNDQGWLVGHGESAWLDNTSFTKPPQLVDITITELAVPVAAATTYRHDKTLAYDRAAGTYRYVTAASPGTASDLPATAGLQEVAQVRVGTADARAGYVWKATDGWHVRVLSTAPPAGGPPIAAGLLAASARPYARRPHLLLDRTSADLVGGANFLLEPDPGPAGGSYVRRVRLDRADLGLAPAGAAAENWGYFPVELDQVVLHPAGYLVGFDEAATLHILALPAKPYRDPFSAIAQRAAGPGSIEGRLADPVSLTVTRTGAIVVLEAAGTLQAFATSGKPMAYFAQSGGPPTVRASLRARPDGRRSTYRSVSADGDGYLFVLSYGGTGAAAADTVLDVYDPAGRWVFSQPGVNAAFAEVDVFRNLSTLDWTPLLDATTGKPQTGSPLGVAEPSTSRWLPCTPGPSGGCTGGLR